MAIEIKKPSELVHTSTVNGVLYGESGVGKSVTLATAPRPLIVSTEDGLLSIRDKDVDVVEAHSLQDMKEIYSYLKEEKRDYDTIGIDSLSELAQVILAKEKANERDPRRAYQTVAEMIVDLVRRFKSLPYHVIFVAKQSLLVDEFTGKHSFGPAFPGRVLPIEVPYLVDEVFSMRFMKKEGKEYRVIYTQPTIQYSAKDRSGKLAEIEKPNLTEIFSKILNATEED